MWFIILTASATGYVLLAVSCVVYALTFAAAKRRTTVDGFIVSRVAVGILLVPVVWLVWGELLAALGRDATLTGRTLLWSWGLDAWRARPILGWGYNAYFESEHAQQMHASIVELRYYDVPHFHESFIQTAVDLGAVGLITFLAMLLATAVGSYRYAILSERHIGVAFFTLTAALAVGALAMYIFPEYNHFATFLLFLLYFSLRSAGSKNLRIEPNKLRINYGSKD
jgi:O-antigen ligase